MILRRLVDSRFSEVLPGWKGMTVVLLGGGASLTRDHLETVRAAHAADRARVIAINDLYLLAPWADAHYAADSSWHTSHSAGVAKPNLGLSSDEVRARWASFPGQKCSIEQSGANIDDDAVHVLRNQNHPNRGFGLSLDPRVLVTGFHSGFQALNLAILAGAETVILCGFDAREPAGAETAHGLTGDHPRPTPIEAYQLYRRAYSAAESLITAAGVTVLNASSGSAINSFAHVVLSDALCAAVA